MDTPELEMRYRTAGAEYLGALKSLGLDPEALFWAYDSVAKQFVLVLITEMVDLKGPYAILQLLFTAYNRAATPKDIDPFILRLHSPKQTISGRLVNYIGWGYVQKVDQKTMEPYGDKVPITGGEIAGLQLKTEWVYQLQQQPRRTKREAMVRKWERFQRNVDRIAA